jgi:tripartite-type tricarboxylate transporter receptor subunit TctC
VGSLPEFVGFAFAQAAGIRLTPVPYRGAAPGVVDLLGGRTASWLGPLGDIATHAKSGQARILATAGAERSKFLPDVPTFAELGFPEATYRDYWGVLVRAGTPEPLVKKINAMVVDAVNSRDFGAFMADQYLDAHACTPQEYAGIIERDRAALAKLVAASGFKPEGA